MISLTSSSDPPLYSPTHLPIPLRLETNPRTIRTSSFVATTESRGTSKGDPNQLGMIDALVQDALLELAHVVFANRLTLGLGNGILPDGHLLGNLWTQPSTPRTHVSVQQLEPSTGKRIMQLFRVLQEPPRHLVVRRIEPQ